MRDEAADYQLLVTWRNLPHVREHWDYDQPTLTLDAVIEELRADTADDAVSVACVIEQDSRPIGYCQFYAWQSFADELAQMGETAQPGWWGIDIFIGDPDLINRGLGTRAVRLLVDYLRKNRGAVAVALDTAVDNARAIRAYEKAGFVKQHTVLDLDTKNGERVECWWMVAR